MNVAACFWFKQNNLKVQKVIEVTLFFVTFEQLPLAVSVLYLMENVFSFSFIVLVSSLASALFRYRK